jgi:GT2 family glycosyltransferase
MTELPKVSVVIINLNGIAHLQQCFASIFKLDYPKDKLEVIVVDNGSSDGSAEFIRQKFNWVKLIENRMNEGFAKPSNDGARAASGEYVAFLNNDMKVKRDWLKELVVSLSKNGAVCAGSVILNWNGDLLDFAGGSVSFYGMGYHYDFQKEMRQVEPTLKTDKQILFACGGAMIVDRQIFLKSGGFDEDYFAYYEDVDLGWRLNILGYRVVLSVKSRVYHRHHGTSGRFASEYRNMLFERNSLYTLYKNTGEELFQKAFMPTVLMNASMIFSNSKLKREDYDLRQNGGELMGQGAFITNLAAVELCALNDFVSNIGIMSRKRNDIQANRKIGDEELTKFIDDPFIGLRSETNQYNSIKYDLAKAFGTDMAFKNELRRHVLVVSGETPQQASRSLQLANALSGFCEVVLASCEEDSNITEHIRKMKYSKSNMLNLVNEAMLSDIIVLQYEALQQSCHFDTVACSKYLVVDLFDTDFSKLHSDENASALKKVEYSLHISDLILCGNDEQKQNCERLFADAFGENCGYIGIIPENEDQLNDQQGVHIDCAAGMKPLTDFCAAPAHRVGRSFDNIETAVSIDASKMSVLERLGRLEKHQAMVEKLLQRNALMDENTRDTLDGIGEWTRQIDRKLGRMGKMLGPFRRIFKK